MKLNTFWGLKGHGEMGPCKFGDARSWSSGEMGSKCVDFPVTASNPNPSSEKGIYQITTEKGGSFDMGGMGMVKRAEYNDI